MKRKATDQELRKALAIITMHKAIRMFKEDEKELEKQRAEQLKKKDTPPPK